MVIGTHESRFYGDINRNAEHNISVSVIVEASNFVFVVNLKKTGD